jgi:hypothetical protein
MRLVAALFLLVLLCSLQHPQAATTSAAFQHRVGSIRQQQKKNFASISPRLSVSPTRMAASRLPLPPPPPPPQPEGLSTTLNNLLDKLDINSLSPFSSTGSEQSSSSSLFVQMDDILNQVTQQFDNVADLLASLVRSLNDKVLLKSLDASILTQLDQVGQSLESTILQNVPQVEPLYQQLLSVLASSNVSISAVSPSIVIALVATVLALVTFSSILTSSSFGGSAISSSASLSLPPPSQPYPLFKYDAVAASAYFDDKFFTSVLQRALEIGIKSTMFAANILQDKLEYVFCCFALSNHHSSKPVRLRCRIDCYTRISQFSCS